MKEDGSARGGVFGNLEKTGKKFIGLTYKTEIMKKKREIIGIFEKTTYQG